MKTATKNIRKVPSKPEPKVHIPVPSDKQHAIRLSNRQFGQLRYILDAPRSTIGLDEISGLNQTTLGGNRRRNFVVETGDKHGITLTWEGKEALRSFENGDFTRRVSSMHFSSFLSLDSYEDSGRKQQQQKQQKQQKQDHSRKKQSRPARSSAGARNVREFVKLSRVA